MVVRSSVATSMRLEDATEQDLCTVLSNSDDRDQSASTKVSRALRDDPTLCALTVRTALAGSAGAGVPPHRVEHDLYLYCPLYPVHPVQALPDDVQAQRLPVGFEQPVRIEEGGQTGARLAG